MIRINFLTLLCLGFLTLGVFSCGDDESSSVTADYESVPVGQMSMTYNGEDWESSTVTGISTSTTISTITSEGGLNLMFIVLESTEVGTYSIGGSNLTSLSMRNLFVSEDYTTENEETASGEIIIDAKNSTDNTISGSFNAVVVDDNGDSRIISSGLFNRIPYSQ